MDSLFTSVLEISWQAGLIALAVMAVRPLLRRAPRRAVCMLWLLVAPRHKALRCWISCPPSG